MRDLRCDCNEHKPLIMKYTDTRVEGKCRKCKRILALEVIDGKLQEVKDEEETERQKETEEGNEG